MPRLVAPLIEKRQRDILGVVNIPGVYPPHFPAVVQLLIPFLIQSQKCGIAARFRGRQATSGFRQRVVRFRTGDHRGIDDHAPLWRQGQLRRCRGTGDRIIPEWNRGA